MPAVQDIKIDDDNDLVIENNDFAIGDSDKQHIEDIIKSYVGHYKEFPLLGVGIDLYINSAGTQIELQTNIRIQLESDGYTVNDVIIGDDSKVYIDAERI